MVFGKYINKYYLRYIYLFVGGALALLFVDYFQLKIPEIIANIIDNISNNSLTIEDVRYYTFEIVKIGAVLFGGRFLWRVCIFGAGILIESHLRDDLYSHFKNLPQSFYSVNKTGGLMSYYTSDLSTIRNCVASGTLSLFDALFLGVLAFIKMLRIDVALSLVALAPLLLIAVMGVLLGRFMSKKFERRQKAFENLSDLTQENISGLSVIKAFVKESVELSRFAKVNKDNVDKNMEFIKLSIIFNIILTVLINVIIGIIILIGGKYVIDFNNGVSTKEFTVGNITEFYSYFGSLIWPMMAIAQLINISAQGRASYVRIKKLMDEKNDILDGNLDKPTKGSIRFENLSFTYPNSELEVLSNINLNIKDGELVGIIGRTGSSKSTLVDLLLRLYNVPENKIFIDDKDIMKLKVEDVRNLIGYVPQDNFLYSDTIKANIAFSDEEINEDKVIESAKLADVYDNIMEFEDKFDTVLGERGVTVSGGQKQRISIARALYKNPEILILDDSLSAVDTETEDIILRNLLNVRKGKTTIIIAHRISTIEAADQIIVMEDGKISGVGKHKELLETNELYSELVRLQKLEDLNGGTI